MVREDAQRWDERHAVAPPAVPAPPEGLAVTDVEVPTEGRALDVACGRGAQVVWAARRGLHVVGLDVSPVAIEATRALAAAHGVARRVDARVHDLDAGLPPDFAGPFDLVVCQRYWAPALVAPLVAALADGGLAVFTVLSAAGAEVVGRHHAPAGALLAAVEATGVAIVGSAEGDGLATVVARAAVAATPPG